MQCRAIELCETIPKVQCKECLLYWSQGIVYCTCGHLLKESEANRGVIQCTLDLLSIPNYVIEKGRPHGHRCGKTPQQRKYHVAIFWRCIKRRFKGIHGRFLNDPDFRASQLEHDRTEGLYQDGRACEKRFLPSYDASRIFSIQKELVDFSQ